jgi:transcriptional regulator GlxA family with amidase domain
VTRIAILTFDGFNEIDSFVALNILNRVPRDGWKAEIASPSRTVTSANGVRIEAQKPLAFALSADVVIIGSGRKIREVVANDGWMDQLALDPNRQLIASQCSGALVLARLGLLEDRVACADRSTGQVLQAAGILVPETPFHCQGNGATAGGCLASHYVATWIIWRLCGKAAAQDALRYVVPVGEEEIFIDRATAVVAPYCA